MQDNREEYAKTTLILKHGSLLEAYYYYSFLPLNTKSNITEDEYLVLMEYMRREHLPMVAFYKGCL